MSEEEEKEERISWHSFSADKVLKKFDTSLEGLLENEVKARLQKYGPNKLTPPRKKSMWGRFFAQFNNTLVYVLLGAGILTGFLGHIVDASVIMGVVVLNSLIGLVQEGKAEKAMDAIRNLLSLQATVFRGNIRLTIPSEQLVPGDIVFIQSGDKLPADIRLIKIKNLRIDESSLTGESLPVEKFTEAVDESKPIGDRTGMAFSGTLVTYGQGTGVVVSTGDDTELGQISRLISTSPTVTTKLIQKISEFGRLLSVSVCILAGLTFVFGIFIRGYEINEMFMAAVGLAVAAIPEGLPAVLSITLAIGVQRMAKRNAIIRRLPSVETLGSVTVICSDKTGTLTRNEMTVKTAITPTDIFDVNGSGYDPKGEFSVRDNSFSCYMAEGGGASCQEYPDLVLLARAGVLCNDTALSQTEGKWIVQGDPTEGAMLVVGAKAGLDLSSLQKEFPRIDMIPFESQHRFMATLHKDNQNEKIVYMKGAPEKILEMCSHQVNAGKETQLDLSFWQNQIAYIASLGQRPLAVAEKRMSDDVTRIGMDDVLNGAGFIGLVGIIDPPRGAAITAIQQCKEAGIRVKMITGDHVLTARAIGAQMGIGDGVLAITGHELDQMDEEALKKAVKRVDVFARVSPEHKLNLVKVLQDEGEVVAMTGDGVNDAPALKRADIGVAMGIKGTEAAKDVSEMILADDNFATIAHAVEEGRTVYENIKKAIMFILPTNIGEAGIIITAILLGRMLPITPVQILWVNMITAVTLALSLAFEPSESNVMMRPPRNPEEPILTPFLIWRIGFVSLVLVAGTFGLFAWERMNGGSIESARTIAVNTLVMFEVFFLFSTRYLKASVLKLEGLLGNGYILGAVLVVVGFQLLFTYTPLLQHLFGTVDIGLKAWGRILLVAPSVLFLVELEKAIFRYYEVRDKTVAIKRC